MTIKTSTSLIIAIVSIILLIHVLLRFYEERSLRFLMTVGFPSEWIGAYYKNDANIQYLLGNHHLGGDGKYEISLAGKFFDQAIMLDDRMPLVHYQKARIHFLNSRYAKALTEVNKELEYNPSFSRSYYLRGLVYGYDGQYHLAALDFARFTILEPEEWAGYVDLSWALFQLGEYAEVRERLEQILPKTRNAWLLNAYGVALLNLGEFEASRSALLEAKDLASRMTPEMWGIAYVGNDPRIYEVGLTEMRKNIDENLERVNNALSQN